MKSFTIVVYNTYKFELLEGNKKKIILFFIKKHMVNLSIDSEDNTDELIDKEA